VPLNRSLFLFRLVQGRKATWDADWIYQATDWRPLDRLRAEQPLAVCAIRENEF
jgi:hypothetical protein